MADHFHFFAGAPSVNLAGACQAGAVGTSAPWSWKGAFRSGAPEKRRKNGAGELDRGPVAHGRHRFVITLLYRGRLPLKN
jgi:hypothetical protein